MIGRGRQPPDREMIGRGWEKPAIDRGMIGCGVEIVSSCIV
ncbi:MAG: hypothetical protein ACOX5F_08850 [Anaerovoracaceae bacterium]|jgi:hypothetical protein